MNTEYKYEINTKHPNGYWTYEKCLIEALKYDNRTSFSKNKAYYISHKNNWLNDICGHMILLRKPNGYWSYEKCLNEALKYNTRSEFSKNSPTTYAISNKNKWTDEICSHMEIKASLKDRYIYAYEFHNYMSVYIGLTWNLKQRNHLHLNSEDSSVYKFIYSNNIIDDYSLKELGYFDMKIVGNKEREYIEYYKNKGWNIINKVRGGGLGYIKSNMTKEKCLIEALKYDTRNKFQKGHRTAYKTATENKWLDDICIHMKQMKKPKNYWTYEKCYEEAVLFKTITEFRKKYSTAYKTAYLNNWLYLLFPPIINHL